MPEDIRESLMSRVGELMEALPTVDKFSRNLNVDDTTSQTRIVLLEGEETVDEDSLARSGNKPPNAPLVIRMQPLLLLSVSDKSDDIGAALSALRGQVIKTITSDATIIGLTLNEHGTRYLGIASEPADLVFAAMTHLQMALRFQFTYLLRPDQFA